MRTQLVVTARTRAVLPYMTPKRFLGNPNYSSGPQEPRDPVIIQPIYTPRRPSHQPCYLHAAQQQGFHFLGEEVRAAANGTHAFAQEAPRADWTLTRIGINRKVYQPSEAAILDRYYAKYRGAEPQVPAALEGAASCSSDPA